MKRDREAIIRPAAVAVSIAFAGTAVVWCGLLTNWFRYGLSLEGLLAMAPIAVATPMALVFLAMAAMTRRLQWLVVGSALFVAGAALSMISHRDAFGVCLPTMSAEHTESSGEAVLMTRGEAVTYRLDLHNPFATSHREEIIVQSRGRTTRIPVSLFDGPSGGFGEANEPSDWIVLRSTSDPNVFTATIGPTLLTEKSFSVNLASGKATLLRHDGG